MADFSIKMTILNTLKHNLTNNEDYYAKPMDWKG